MGPPSTSDVETLAGLLTADNADVGYWAATLLGRLGSDAVVAVPALATAVAESRHRVVRQRAAWALGKIGSPAIEAVGALKQAAIMDRMVNSPLQTLLQTAKECHDLLDAEDIPHVVIGGLAVCLHGYERSSRDVDLLVRRQDWDRIRTALTSKRFTKKTRTEFLSPEGVKVGFRCEGGDPEKHEAYLPDPANAEFLTMFDDLPGMPVYGDLVELIRHKLECAVMGQRRGGRWAKRSKKHFKDVVGLIVSNDLLP